MATATTNPCVELHGVTHQLRQFNCDEYMSFAEAGIFESEERVELIDGLIVERYEDGGGPRIMVMGVPMQPHAFTADQFMRMVALGVFDTPDHTELVDGMITVMSPAGSPHNFVLNRLNQMFGPLMSRAIISIQGTMVAQSKRVFDPDFRLLQNRDDFYKHALPTPDDVLLLVEVSDSSLQKDQTSKLIAYAEAGIAEYWIADCNNEVLYVYRQPVDDHYTQVEIMSGDDRVSPLAFEDFVIRVGDMFD